jgi:uncharacterized protein (DUF58 family)
LITLAFVILHGEWIAWVSLYAVLILPALSLLYILIAARGVTASHSVDGDKVIKNDEIIYTVTFVNKGWLPVYGARIMFASREDAPQPFRTDFNLRIVSVFRWRRVEVDFPVTCLFRGVFALRADKIEVCDILGLFVFNMNVSEPLDITVYPALSELRSIPLSAVNASDAPSIRETADEDYAVITDLRTYQPEDSFKRVHWKISAKKQSLMVKSFQSVNLNASVLVLNNRTILFDRPHTDMERVAIEDKLVECVISFAHYSLLRRFPVELYFMDKGFRRVAEGSYSGFGNIYNVCAGIKFDNPPDFTDHVESLLHNQEEFINLVIFTSEMDKSLCENLRGAKAAGHNVIAVYTETRKEGLLPNLDEGLRRNLAETGAAVYYIPFENGIGDIFL